MEPSFDVLLKRMDQLSAQFVELKEGVHLVISVAKLDPEMALTRARKVLEYVVRDVYERRVQHPAGTQPLENLLQRLAKDKFLPARVEAYANTIRMLGNVGTHSFGEKVTGADVAQSLSQLMPVLEWYFEVEHPDAFSQVENKAELPPKAKEQLPELKTPHEESANGKAAGPDVDIAVPVADWVLPAAAEPAPVAKWAVPAPEEPVLVAEAPAPLAEAPKHSVHRAAPVMVRPIHRAYARMRAESRPRWIVALAAGGGLFLFGSAALCVGFGFFRDAPATTRMTEPGPHESPPPDVDNNEQVKIPRLADNAKPSEIWETFNNRVYTIRIKDGLGSGTLIAHDRTRGLVVTTIDVLVHDKDILEGLKKPSATVPDLNVWAMSPALPDYKQVQCASLDPEHDLALLIVELDSPDREAITVGRTASLNPGEPAVAVGNQGTDGLETTTGVISGINKKENHIRTSCLVSYGFAGGPLFVERQGLLVGIVYGKDRQNIGLAVPLEGVITSLQDRQSNGAWVWAPDLKEITLQLADLVPLEK